MSEMRKCKKLVEEYKKYRSKYIKKQIRHHERIKNPNILEQWQLCQNYQSLCHIEGSDNGIYELCKTCKYNVNDAAYKAMHDPTYEYEIIWGNVYAKVIKGTNK